MSGQINKFWTYYFGFAVIKSAELNTETEKAETLENVMQFMIQKCELVKRICELFGDNLCENRPYRRNEGDQYEIKKVGETGR